MNNYTKQYINGEWVDSTSGEYIDVINPATEEVFGKIAKGNKEDVDKAVEAADSVYPDFYFLPDIFFQPERRPYVCEQYTQQ